MKKGTGEAQDKLEDVGIDSICSMISSGATWRAITEALDISAGALCIFFLRYPEQYARAKEQQAELMAMDIMQIADEPVKRYIDANGVSRMESADVQDKRVRIDTRKWLMSKMAVKKYGDKLQTEISGINGGPIIIASKQDEEL